MEYWKFYSKSDYIKIAPSYSTDMIAVFIQRSIYLEDKNMSLQLFIPVLSPCRAYTIQPGV